MTSLAQSLHRWSSIDRLRGAVMALMAVDHVREFFFLHQQVADPMDLATTSPELFFTRLCSHFCAPVFVLLTGLSAWLRGSRPGASRRDTAVFLAQRGAILIGLELTLVNFAWTFSLPPPMIYLQVIWAIGLSMLALAALIYLPRPLQWALALLIIAGHNALDGLHFQPDEAAFIPWAILHDRSVMLLGWGLRARSSYPVLPWIGVMLLGYALGPLYSAQVASRSRRAWLTGLGLLALLGFGVLRQLNGYGDHAWVPGASPLHTLMAFLNVTKYPPSLQFLLLTLGLGLLALALFERIGWAGPLADIGGAPMFFYLVHLYLLYLLHWVLLHHVGPNHGGRFGLDEVWQIWALAAGVVALLYGPCRWFARVKRNNPSVRWLRYF
ncbi:DUF1624 domain-containing protein [Curvibacter gracilis]|uniref:DUF1624 domain-containing protein n=1 Tax=Curvibacter gracilis TaxID=230310 RepID=UPI000481F8CC|nr:heparan-alpha-glucosaminide N-acetyltransferase domain-containing protein [Curvibacter gracilis]